MPKIRILLLTNRDSDNVGDQIIEATVISILKGIMRNFDIPDDEYSITSRAAGIISKKYLRTGDAALLEDARATIAASDLIVFGGSPLFNYSYQNFYLRTIKTLELAEEYGVPVLFSSIGVEEYDGTNPKCLELKKALSLPCVRQITTRDDFESLEKYVEGTGVPISHVADPAVFADFVFEELGSKAPGEASPDETARRIGLVVTRSGIFKDNRIVFSESQQRKFWVDVIEKLEQRGDDYRLFTTGHFSDEVFLDALVRTHNIPLSKVAITINSPEELIEELTACDGIIAYRLHASITSYAYRVPSVGLSWNSKVPYFYEAIGCPERALSPEQWTAEEAIRSLDTAMESGVTQNDDFKMSVYTTLFAGIKNVLFPDSEVEAFGIDQMEEELPKYEGTSAEYYRSKVGGKLRRTYENYQRFNAERPFHLKYPARFHSGTGSQRTTRIRMPSGKKLEAHVTKSGALEYGFPGLRYRNDGLSTLDKNCFRVPGYDFVGWKLRFRVFDRWFWYLADGSIQDSDASGGISDDRKAVIADCGEIPHLPVDHVNVVVFVAQWSRNTSLLGGVNRELRNPKAIPGKIYRKLRQVPRSTRR